MPFRFNPFTRKLDIVDISSIPPGTVVTLTGDSGGAIPPDGSGNINVFGSDTTSNNDNGLTSVGAGNTITYQLTNRQTGTVATTDATVTTILTVPMGVTPGTFYVFGNVQAFNSSTPASAAYSFSGGYRTSGAAATQLGTEFHDTFQDAVLTTTDIFLTTSGNNILVQVQGVVALNINWNAILEYRQVT